MNSNLRKTWVFLNAANAFFRRRVHYRFEMIEYDIKLLPRQLMNLTLNAVHAVMPRAPMLSFPPVLQIEPTNACNLNCTLCPSGMGRLGRAKHFLDFNVYKRLLDEIGQYALLMQFWGWGEPFLHPRAYDMIRYAKMYNITVVTSTNMQAFSPKYAVDELVECGLDTLIVAIDGTTQEAYEKYRVKGHLGRILKRTEQILEARERHGVTHPLINFQFMVMRHNEHQVEEIQSLSERLEVDFLTLRTVSPHGGPLDSFRELIPRGKRFRRFGGANGLPQKKPGKSRKCLRPFSKAMVFSDGAVGPCEEDYSAKEIYGRLDGMTGFRDIWFSDRARRFRKQFIREDNVFPFCRACPYKARVQDDCVVAGFCYNRKTVKKLCHKA
ncbi:MAG: radical SAM protein [Anaerolineales bacterium]|nr:radical SAM protein [Anaerolineales bacterium]